MRTLKPFHPFEGVFPAVLKGFPMLWDEGLPPAIKLDIEEGDKAYLVKAEIPGVKKEDILVDVDGPAVTIRAELRRETREGKEPNALLTERIYGMLSRTFTLPVEVNADATQARYENGVLLLTLPWKAETAAHRVTVN